jgi:hypothetical protein
MGTATMVELDMRKTRLLTAKNAMSAKNLAMVLCFTSIAFFAVIPLFLLAQTNDLQHGSFFMGRLRYSSNDGNDCSGVGRNMAQLVSQISTVPIRDEQKVALKDPELFSIPFLFMNGHNDFVLDDEELGNLRSYLDHGGFLFASGCCTNPAFPQAWRRELSRVFPNESVQPLPYDHPIYRTFYTIGSVQNLHENRDIHLEGLTHDGRIVAVICEDGLCCAFSMDNQCNVGHGVSPDDGKKLALNIGVYAMTH